SGREKDLGVDRVGLLEELLPARSLIAGQELLQFGAEGRLAGARLLQECVALARCQRLRLLEQLAQPLIALWSHLIGHNGCATSRPPTCRSWLVCPWVLPTRNRTYWRPA